MSTTFLKKFHFFLAYWKLHNLDICRANKNWKLIYIFFFDSGSRTPTAALRPLFKAVFVPGASVGESRGIILNFCKSALYKGASRKD